MNIDLGGSVHDRLYRIRSFGDLCIPLDVRRFVKPGLQWAVGSSVYVNVSGRLVAYMWGEVFYED